MASTERVGHSLTGANADRAIVRRLLKELGITRKSTGTRCGSSLSVEWPGDEGYGALVYLADWLRLRGLSVVGRLAGRPGLCDVWSSLRHGCRVAMARVCAAVRRDISIKNRV